MASAGCKKNSSSTATTTRRNNSSSRRPVVLIRRAMLHSSLCFLVGLITGLVAPSEWDWPLLAPAASAVFLRAINSSRNIIILHATGGGSVDTSTTTPLPLQQPQLLVVVTTTEGEQYSDPERRAAGLTRTAHALRLVSPPLLWLVVEAAPDNEHAAPPTALLLRRTGVVHRHLHLLMSSSYKQQQQEARREQQRNLALRHIEDHRIAGVVLFSSLADVYDLRLLHSLRDIRTFGAWPVATVSAYDRNVAMQGPLCTSSMSHGWLDMVAGGERRPVVDRPPPDMLMDVAGFAFSSSLLWDPHRWDRFPVSEPDISQESVKFVQRLLVEEYNQSTTRGMPDSNCSQIMLWRIQTTL